MCSRPGRSSSQSGRAQRRPFWRLRTKGFGRHNNCCLNTRFTTTILGWLSVRRRDSRTRCRCLRRLVTCYRPLQVCRPYYAALSLCCLVNMLPCQYAVFASALSCSYYTRHMLLDLTVSKRAHKRAVFVLPIKFCYSVSIHSYKERSSLATLQVLSLTRVKLG